MLFNIAYGSRPEVSHHSGLVGLAAAFVVGFGGFMLVSFAGKHAALTCMVVDGDVMAMHPAII